MANKGTIFEETAEVVEQLKFEAGQFVTIVKAEKSSQTMGSTKCPHRRVLVLVGVVEFLV